MDKKIIHIAEDFVETYFPSAHTVFLAGSVLTNFFSKESDIDLVIVDETQKNSKVECFLFNEWKVEAFVYSTDSLFMQFYAARYKGVPTIIKMCAEGKIIIDNKSHASNIKEEAAAMLKRGPSLYSEADINQARYKLTESLSDFVSSDHDGESLFILNDLVNQFIPFVLRGNGNWIGYGKWRARCLELYDEQFYQQFITAYESYLKEKNKSLIINVVKEKLDQFGGELFDGYKEEFF